MFRGFNTKTSLGLGHFFLHQLFVVTGGLNLDETAGVRKKVGIDLHRLTRAVRGVVVVDVVMHDSTEVKKSHDRNKGPGCMFEIVVATSDCWFESLGLEDGK